MFVLGSVVTAGQWICLHWTHRVHKHSHSLGSLIGLADFIRVVSKDTISLFPYYLPHLPIILQSQTCVAKRVFCNLLL